MGLQGKQFEHILRESEKCSVLEIPLQKIIPEK